MQDSAVCQNTAYPWQERLKDTFRAFSLTNYQEVTTGGMVVCFLAYLILLAVFPMEPPDDLLRHMKSHAYGYDYRLLYASSPGIPAFNMYYLFDSIVGWVYQVAGPNGYVLVQAACTTVFGAGIFWMLRGATSTNLRFALTMIALALCFNRIALARPSTFESGLFLVAIAAAQDERVKWWFHLLLGLVMASFYYLFWVYFIPLVLIRRSYAVALLAGLAGWFWYGGEQYLWVLKSILTMKANRGVEIAESASMVYATLPVMVLLMPVLFYWRKDIKKLFVIGWFYLSNQLRYFEVVTPLFVSYAKNWPVRLSQSAVILIFITASCWRVPTRPDESWTELKGIVPAGSRVVTLDMNSMFKLVYGNERISVAPCMEPGWDTKELVKAMTVSMKTGTLDTDLFKVKEYDYLVEKNLKEMPKGFELVRLAGKYRVWKVPAYLRPNTGTALKNGGGNA